MSTEEFHKQTTLPRLVEPGDGKKTPLPKKIGPYKIESLLSEGGMSLLYLARHPDKDEPIVIKVLSPRYMTHPEMKEQFLKETHIIEIADHPNIVKLYGEGVWENGLYIAMEFIQGISLKQFIRQSTLSVRRTLEVTLQVAYALLHLHSHGIIHRDLKPENILITESGEIKVVDFGISQLTYEPPRDTFSGTPSYMSPEQKENPLHVSATTDIYSLGVIMYELLMGRASKGDLQLSLLPPELRKIVGQATALADERYTDIVTLIHDISSYLKQKELGTISDSDEVHTIWSNFHNIENVFLPKAAPKWPHLEIGIARPEEIPLLNFYYDFFRLSSGGYVVVMAESNEKSLDAIVYLGVLRGHTRALIPRYEESGFDALSFTSELNARICDDTMRRQFAYTTLYLDPQNERFQLVNCGFRTAWHLAPDSITPHVLHLNNPLLGSDPSATFEQATDNWDPGDLLLLHSFDVAFGETLPDIEEHLRTLVADTFQYVPEIQAKRILSSLPSTRGETNAVLTLTRLPT